MLYLKANSKGSHACGTAHWCGMRVEFTSDVQSALGKCMGCPVAGHTAFHMTANATIIMYMISEI